MYDPGRPDSSAFGRDVLLDRLLDLRSRMDQRGRMWDDPWSSALKDRIAALLDRILSGRSIELTAFDQEVRQCRKECDRLMGPSQTDENKQLSSYHSARARLKDIEDQWRGLEQTVPPHASEWWEAHMAGEKPRITLLRAQFDRFSQDSSGWPAVEADFHKELNELEKLLAVAKAELGSRTAAGRAKADLL